MQREPRDAVRGMTATTIAGSFGLAAFAVAIIAGLASGNAASSILLRALMAMVICYPVGLAVGLVAQRIVNDEIGERTRDVPLPEFSDVDEPSDEGDRTREPENRNETSDEEVLVV